MTDEYRSIKLRITVVQEAKSIAKEVADERGGTVTVPDIIHEAIKFYKLNRPTIPEASK